jgi:hypothetical protein
MTCIALAIHFRDFSFVLNWFYAVAVFGIACVAIFVIWSLTIWPLAHAIARLFQRSRD